MLAGWLKRTKTRKEEKNLGEKEKDGESKKREKRENEFCGRLGSSIVNQLLLENQKGVSKA